MQDYGKLHSIKKKIIGSGRNIRSCYLKDRSTNKKVYFLEIALSWLKYLVIKMVSACVYPNSPSVWYFPLHSLRLLSRHTRIRYSQGLVYKVEYMGLYPKPRKRLEIFYYLLAFSSTSQRVLKFGFFLNHLRRRPSLQNTLPYFNRIWPTPLAGKADSVSSKSASACHIGGPNSVNPGQILLVYGMSYD